MASGISDTQRAELLIARAIADAIRPDPPLSVWKWADEYRMLSSKAASAPGKYRSERTPYLREIMDCLSVESPIRRVVVKKPAQVGFSEALNNWIGYVIHHAPGPMLLVQPTVDLCKRYSKQRIAPMINETPVLTSRVAEEKSRDSSNTMLEKEFPGGMLLMTGANSSVGLRSMPAKFLALDEIDAYPPNVDDEGDPIELAVARTSTFARSKICMGSTPTVTGRSRIDIAFEETDQRQFWLPCPHCKDLQVLQFARLVWPKGRPEKVEYQCIHCNQFIQNYQKTWMLARGEWRPTVECDPTIRGYALSGLLSPVGWLNWASIAAKYEQAEKKTDFLQTFYNTVLGESYSLGGETPNDARLYERRESYPIGRVPRGGLFLTGAVDVQGDRLEIEIKAWGRGRENWSVDYIVIDGNPKEQTVWDQLTEVFESSWPSEYGATMKLSRLAVDSGYAADQVYAWARGKGSTVMVIKGDSRVPAVLGAASAVEVGPMGRKIKSGAKVWPVNVNFVKEELYRWLNLDAPDLEAGEAYPDGYCHFPQYNREYFAQLTAEQLVTITDKHGYRKTQWQKLRERNEALDLAVYNRAAAVAWGIDRMEEKHWAHLEQVIGAKKSRLDEAAESPNTVTPEQPPTQIAPPAPPASTSSRRRIRFRFN